MAKNLYIVYLIRLAAPIALDGSHQFFYDAFFHVLQIYRNLLLDLLDLIMTYVYQNRQGLSL